MIKLSILFFSIIINVYCVHSQRELRLETTILTEREVAIGLDVPWEMTWGPDDHIWFTEREGRVKRMHPETGNVQLILDHTDTVSNIDESGMLGLCFHPDFISNGILYIAYDYGENLTQLTKRLSTFNWNGTTLENEEILLDDIRTFRYHSGCRLLISRDDKLLMTLGDIFRSDYALDLNRLHGKLLRIDLDGSIPDDNPFPDSYVYAYGLRNSQGLAFGPDNQLYLTDHGTDQSDEFNRVLPGANYGWPEVLGACDNAEEELYCNQENVIEPLLEWTPTIAISDIIYYDHPAIPEWNGKMLMSALGGFAKDLWAVRILSFSTDGTAATEDQIVFDDYGRLRDICINPHNGAIYFATNGRVYPSSGPNRIIEYRNMEYTMTSTIDNDESQYLRISPVPLKKGDKLNLDYSESFSNTVLEVYDLSGQLLNKIPIARQKSISTSSLKLGQYFVKASNELGTITQRFIVVE